MSNEALEFMELGDNLEFNTPLTPEDALYVDTEKARGDFTFNNIYHRLGIDSQTMELLKPMERQYLLFMGHVGCGKSTELLRLKENLHGPDHYYVIHFDISRELDFNNFQYVDLLFVCAQKLLTALKDEGLDIDPVYLGRLDRWFQQEIITRTQDRIFSAEVSGEISAGLSFSGMLKLVSKVTSIFKTSSSHKRELREVVRSSFLEFADIFNELIQISNEVL
ncbi:MAG: hypothetical protein HQL99_08415, partial [Magnetococcales bacterium]|nr:hypothetical protein [Magnetococcales bacterium]